ncbi:MULTISPECIES: hypothetical protein [unclassified Limnobacter]|uniref:DUF6966 domain-containing protein n=1 Tax=unclassified Limnobacter TaxID=2630203 RepID=UPI0025BE2509|nr:MULTISPECIES: hypothetical protein [unclassified Limnobacter]
MKSTELILQQLITLLEKSEETNWSASLRSLMLALSQCANDSERNYVRSQLKSIFGGMGSFSDLVLYKNAKVLVVENNQLETLRRALFESLK